MHFIQEFQWVENLMGKRIYLTFLIIMVTSIVVGCNPGSGSRKDGGSEKVVAAYYSVFDPEVFAQRLNANPPFEKLNRVFISFAQVDSTNGKVRELDLADQEKNIKTLIEAIKAKNSYMELVISITDGLNHDDQKGFKLAASTDEMASGFAESLLLFMQKYGFHGWDIDWEGNIDGEMICKLIDAVRTRIGNTKNPLGKPYFTAIAVWPNPVSGYKQCIWDKVDFVNFMSYGESGVGREDLIADIDSYKSQFPSFDVKKSVGGCRREGLDTGDSNSSIVDKCKYVKEKGLSGMFIWRTDNDTVKGSIPTFEATNTMADEMNK